jgi:hypothetical protein
MEFKALAVKVAAAPVQHLLVNIDSYIPAGECFVFEFVVPEMLGKPAATTTDIQNVRVQAAKPGKKCVQPKIPSLVQIKHLIRKDAIADATLIRR